MMIHPVRLGLGAAGIVFMQLWSAALAQTVVFTNNTLIAAGNVTYEGSNVVARGCTVTLQGDHAFGAFTIQSNAVVDSTSTNLAVQQLALNSGTLRLAGGSVLTVPGAITVATNSLILCQGINTAATNAAGQWVGAGVTITASNVTVAVGGKISADGQGYIGTDGKGNGTGGGIGGRADTPGGGGGGGYGGAGGLSQGNCAGGVSYGLALAPTELGSAGGAGFAGAGGAGGGALRLSVGGELRLDGRISANGADGNGSHSYGASGGGSGGSLWVTARNLMGAGVLTANGGAGPVVGEEDGGGGSGGRIVVSYADGSGFSGFTNSTASAGASYGPANVGTAMFVDTGVPSSALHVYQGGALQGTSATYAAVTVYQAGVMSIASNFVLNAQTLNIMTGSTVTVGGGSTLNLSNALAVGVNATLFCQGVNTASTNAGGQWAGRGVTINASNVTVAVGARISADGQGYTGTDGQGNGTGGGIGGRADTPGGGGGGGYGGVGGLSQGNCAGGVSYGLEFAPTDLGSAGGAGYAGAGGAGGGALRLSVGGELMLDGRISANGADGNGTHSWGASGGGAGGSLWVTTRDLTGAGGLYAKGGAGPVVGEEDGGGGSGGRIAVYYADGSGFSGYTNSSASAGASYGVAGAGTLLFLDASEADDHLHVFQSALLQGTSAAFGSITVHPAATLSVGSNFVLAARTLNVTTGATVSVGGGSTVNVTDTFFVGSNSTVVCRSVNNTATNASGQWVGAGVTINASNAIIEAGGKLSADGQGYVGTSVYNATGLGAGGSGRCSGGSHGGFGGYGNNWAARGSVYGSSLQPTDLGSSGGNYDGYVSGAGGGAIRLNLTGTLALNGQITASGASGASRAGAGAGGSLWVTAQTLTGNGLFLARGANNADYYGGAGGGGRIAVYYAAAGGFGGFTGSTAAGGLGWTESGAAGYGSKGTVAFLDTSVSNMALSVYENYVMQSISATLSAMNVYTGATVVLPGGLQLGLTRSLFIASNATVTCLGANTTSTNASGQWAGVGVTINSSNVTVAAGGKLTADGQGYAGTVVFNGTGLGAGGSGRCSGGSHGGLGGYGNNWAARGTVYGTALQPTDLGSSGGNYEGYVSGAGGGAIRLNLTGALTLNGTLSANGASGASRAGAGAGGSLWVTAPTLTGNGAFLARGANNADYYGGAGGGGRIAVYYAGGGFVGFTNSTAAGGLGWTESGAAGYGAKGTVLFMDTSVSNSDLHVYESLTLPSTALVFRTVQVYNGASLTLQGTSLVCGAFNVYTGAAVTLPGGAAISAVSLWVASNATVTCQGLNNTATNASGQWAGAGVTITASNLTVDAGAKITADRQGYVGGLSSGAPGAGPGGGLYTGGGWTSGGGGYGGSGGSSRSGGSKGASYGLALAPVELGSGGSADSDGGNLGGPGGGAIRLVVLGALTNNGLISASGGSGVSGDRAGGGSGGSLWVNTGVLAGGGRFVANGGDWLNSYGAPGGGGGRIAVYYRAGAGFSGFTNSTASAGASYSAATVGTVLFLDTSLPNNALRVYQNYVVQGSSQTFGTIDLFKSATLTIPGGTELTVDRTFWVASNATVTCQGANNTATNASGQWVGQGVTINASNLTVDAGGQFTADRQGYVGGLTTGARGAGPGGGGYTGSGWTAAGGGYGGKGGSSISGGVKGASYGLALAPVELGSGGSADSDGGNLGGPGGGAIRLNIQNAFTNNGLISANGGSGVSGDRAGGGSGGALWVNTGVLAGGGRFVANGGNWLNSYGGPGGGGGRIAVYYRAGGGFSGYTNTTASAGASYSAAEVGTAMFIDTSVPNNALHVYQNGAVQEATETYATLTVYRAGTLTVVSNRVLNVQTMNILTGATVTVGGGVTVNVGDALLQSNVTWICQSVNNASTNASGQWVGAGVTVNASNLTLEAGAKITADAQGYVGWQPDGIHGCGPGTSARVDDISPGAGYGGAGGSDRRGRPGGGTYGSPSEPTDLGSGAPPDERAWGGPGGGAVRLNVTGTLNHQGTISANGGGSSAAGSCESGAGSGGSVWVTARALAGSGSFKANGGTPGSTYWGGAGGGGRVAVYYATNSGFSGFASSTANGGSGDQPGSKGTVGFYGITGGGTLEVYQNYTLPGTSAVFETVSVYNGAALTLGSSFLLNVQNLGVGTGGTLYAGGGSLLNVGSVLLVASNGQLVCQGRDTRARVGGVWAGTGVTINAESVLVELGGKITADAQGYVGGLAAGAAGAGPGGGFFTGGGSAWYAGGGGFGGSGGIAYYGGVPGALNGSLFSPSDLGSGGAADSDGSNLGGPGGGALRLNVRTSLVNNGIISANGGSGVAGDRGGGGSGGSVWIFAPDLAGSGWYKANGGNQLHGYAAGGGGGRMAFYVDTLSTSLNAQCLGGTSYGGSTGDVRGSGGGSVAVVYGNALTAAQTNLMVTGGSGGSLGAVIVRRDSDFDGLADSSETGFWRTNPALADTDGDGVSDVYEATHGTDPTNAVSFGTSLAGRVLYSGSQTGVVWVTARNAAVTNRALRTSGTGYVNVGDKPSLRMTNAITMSAWINLADATGDQPILVKEGNGKCSYWFGVYNYRFGLLIGTGANWGLWARSGGSVSTGVWTHVTSTWDGTNWCSYLNGELAASGRYTGAMLTSTAPVQIGQNSEWASTHFKGMIDEVRVWNRALSADEIQAGLFTKPVGNEAGLAGYWNFDTGAATDLTTNANHGTLVNDAAVVTNDVWGMGAYRTRLSSIAADYRIADVLVPASYTVWCYRDFNLNGVQDFWESQASFTNNPVLVTNAVTGIDMTLPVVVPPTAQAGGPYSVDEFSGNAYAGAWSVPVDGGASTDTISGSTLLKYQWDFGVDGFDGTALNSNKWLFSASGVSQSNQVSITGSSSWGARYFFSRDTFPRTEGMAVEYKVKFTAGESMLGFKNTTADFSYTQLTYGLYFYNYGIAVHEDGTSRGWSGWSYAYDTWYDIRIELGTTVGAKYFYRRSGDSAWNLIYESTYSAATLFRRGLTVYSSSCTLDDLRELTAGKTPAYRLYDAGTRPVTLTVTDPSGLSDTDSTTVTTLKNALPVAHLTPSAQTRYETNAADCVWTFPFSATNSVDDHGGTTNGIYTCEWDWAYDGTFRPSADTGSTVTHAWTNAGTYTVALRVTDHVLQTSVDTATVTVVNGTQPTARPGGPYAFDEFTGNASTGAWNVVVSGTNSSDSESSLVQYRWLLGTDTFDGTSLNPQKWMTSAAGVGQTNQVYITGAGTWGQRYLFSADTYPRVRGMAFETAARFDVLGHAMVGFKNANTTFNYNQMPYAVYFVNNGDLMIYEDATSRGVVGKYATGVWYNVRIELKPTAGALYYVQTNSAAAWTLLYDSNYGSATSFRRGSDVYSGTFRLDDLKEITAGASPVPYRLYEAGTRTVTLTVWDQALNTNSAATTMTLNVNQPPSAVAGGNKFGTELNCVGGLWSFVFSAAASADDHGIYQYEWDWDYNAGVGFRPSGDTGVSVTHPFPVSRLGTNTVAVRVTDQLMQATVNPAFVILSKGQAPVAHAGGPYTAQVGSWLTLNGSASSDDNEVAQYAWDFGDGGTGTGATPQHRYSQTNDYTVTLVVYDTCNQASATATSVVHVVAGVAPVADAGGPYSGAAGGPPAYFDGRNSHDGLGSPLGIAKFIWDANIATNSDGVGGADDDMDLGGATPFFTYDAVGVYTAKLAVVDGINQSNTAYAVVTIVSNLAPHVLCVPYHGNTNSYHPTYSGRAVTLKGIVRDAGALTYSWNFGDGSTTAVQAVANKYALQAAHSYTGSIGKTYSARLTVWDSTGLSGSDSYLVAVTESNLETRAQIAVDEGLWWLHKDQVKSTGRWSNYAYGGYYASSDASALQAFVINGHRVDGWTKTDPYVETVEKGFRDLFTLLRTNAITSVVISSLATHESLALASVSGTESLGGGAARNTLALAPEEAPSPISRYDINGNGKGVDVNSDRKTYELGMVMDALASSQARSTVAITGPAGVKGFTFFDLVSDMADTYIAGQNHSGSSQGGWRYTWNSGDADNSISQWGAIGLRAAEDSFGITCPQIVKTDNKIWLNASWNGSNFGYNWANTYARSWDSTTPSALVQMSMDSLSTTNAMWKQTEYYITDNWSTYGGSGYNYYGLYALVKAFRLARPTPVVYLQKNSLDWYNDPAQGVKLRVTNDQIADGSWDKGWSSSEGLGRDLSTAWAIIMLTPTLFTQPPRAVITASPVWGYGIPMQLSAENSFSVDARKSIVKYLWDFDNDGNFDLITSNATDTNAVWTWPDPHPAVTGDVPVTVTVRLKVVDNDDPPQSEETFKTIIIAEPPHAPYAHATVPKSASAGVRVTLSASGSIDIDPTDIITQYQWDFNNDDVPDLVTNAVAFSWRFMTPGRQTVALRVVDNGVMNSGVKLTSEWDYATCSVNDNQAPVADAGGPYTVYEGLAVTLFATNSVDPNGDDLLYAWDFDGDGAADATNAVTEHTWNLPGSNTVWLTVTDTALSNSVSVSFMAQSVNHAPSYAKGADQSVNEDSGPRTVAGWASALSAGPAHEAWQTFAFVCSNTAPALFSVPPGVSTNGTLTFTPAPNANGTATVSLWLQDNGGTAYGGQDTSATQTFQIVVNAVNDAPVLTPTNAAALFVSEDSADNPQWVVNIAGSSISDVDAGALKGIAVFATVSGNGAWQYSTNWGVSWSAMGAVSTNAALLLRAQDGMRFVPDLQNGTTANFSYFAWDQTSGSVGTKQSAANRGGTTAYSLACDTNSVIVASANDAPVLTVPTNCAVNELTLLSVTNAATDVDLPANTLRFELLAGPSGLTLGTNTGAIAWTPTEAQGPSTNTVTVRVVDNGTPVKATTNSFTVWVSERNSAPALTVPTNCTLNELTLLAVTNTATDADLPANTLRFELLAWPSGMSIGTNTGAVAWTPSEAQGPSTNTVTVRVYDSGTPSLAATNSFTVWVNEVNSAPALTVPTNRVMNELTLLAVTNTATDADLPANTLRYELLSGPSGLALGTNTGAIAWTPTEAQGPSTNTVTVRVVDSGVPVKAATNSFTVWVNEVNAAPVLPVQTNRQIRALALLTVTNAATDADIPVNALTYQLLVAPTGAAISNGVITWTPTVLQGASTNTFTTRVADNGSPSRAATNSFQVIVLAANTRPVLAPIKDFTLAVGETLGFRLQATDTDWPSNTLTYSQQTFYLYDPPVNAALLNAYTGQFSWTATEWDEGNVLWFAVTVTDNGVPPLATTRVFEVRVAGHLPSLGFSLTAGTPSLMWNAVPSRRYQIQYKDRLTDDVWWNLGSEMQAVGDVLLLDDDTIPKPPSRFYRAVLVPEP